MRILAGLFLLAAVAGAEELAVRVAAGIEPIEGASIKVLKPDEEIVFDSLQWAPDAQTDATGQAVVEATGGWVLVYMPGYTLAVARADGQLLDIALEPERIFAGKVVDSKGEPVAGADIYLRTTFKRKAAFHARTDAEGKFHVYGLWFDNYAVDVEAPGFVVVTREFTETQSGATITIPRTASITGTVRDKDGTPLEGLLVSARGSRAKTRVDGTYRIEPVDSEREYRVGVEFPWSCVPRVIWPKPGEVVERVDFVARPPATLQLRVLDGDGKPLPGVSVKGSEQQVTDPAGKATLRILSGWEGTLELKLEDHVLAKKGYPGIEPGAVLDLGDIVLQALPVIEVRVRLPDGTVPKQGMVGGAVLQDGVARVVGTHDREIAVPGYPTVDVQVAPPGPVEVTLPEPLWIRGIVVDAYGAPVEGAAVEGVPIQSYSANAESDAAGRFLLGPFAGVDVEVRATTPAAASRTATVKPGEGELELIVRGRQASLLAGRVVRGVRPVRRFRIGGTDYVDEEGRFELLLERAELSWVTVEVDEREFHFPLPLEGQQLVARLPAEAVSVTPEGAGSEVDVWLRRAGVDPEEYTGDDAVTGDDGIARFANLPAGEYIAGAGGYESQRFSVGGGVVSLVTLSAVAQGTLRVKLPPGFEGLENEPWSLDPGLHLDVFDAFGPYSVWLDAVRIRAGVETVIEFAPANGGSVTIHGRPRSYVQLDLARPDSHLVYGITLGADGIFRLPHLPTGAYDVAFGARRVRVEVVAGEAAELLLVESIHVLAGGVVFKSGKPAQGVSVHLGSTLARTDLAGGFRFTRVPEGEHVCVAEADGYVSTVAVVRVDENGVSVDGLPLRLTPDAGSYLHVLGRAGEPLPRVVVNINGRRIRTDWLGRLRLLHAPARLDVDLEGYASLRDVEVSGGETIRLQRGADLVILADDPSQVVVRVDGRPWRRARRPLADPPGEIHLRDLPPGPVEVELPPVANGEDTAEDSDAEEEPRIERLTLESGAETVLDLRAG